jgi:anti-sigma B factor antagonist
MTVPTIDLAHEAADPAVRPVGEIDGATVDRFADTVRSAVDSADGSGPVTVDMSGVTFIDSTAIGALVNLRIYAQQRDHELRLTGCTDRLLRLLDILGLRPVFGL